MTILIDPPLWVWQGRRWSHMISDEGLDDLHAFARRVPLRCLSFGIDHYDVPEDLYQRVLDLGGVPADGRELVAVLRRLGLRKRRGKVARTWERRNWTPDAFTDEVVERVVVLENQLRATSSPSVYFRPGTTVVMIEGTHDPMLVHSDEVLTRWGALVSVELVIGDY